MNERSGRRSHPSRLRLEGWLSGEQGGGTAELEAHMASCPACTARLDRMRSKGERFRFRNPSFAALSARLRRPPKAPRLGFPWPGWPAPAFAALTLAAVGALLWGARPRTDPDPGSGKGSPSLQVFDSRRNLLDHRDTVKVRAGDTLQLAMVSQSPIHYRVFSRAENGALAELMPLAGEPDSLGASMRAVPLPHSLVFAAPVKPERIICVWSRFPLDRIAARALLAGGRPDSGSGADSFQVAGAP